MYIRTIHTFFLRDCWRISSNVQQICLWPESARCGSLRCSLRPSIS